MKKKQASSSPAPGSGPQHLAPLSSTILGSCSNVVAHCCVVRYDDGDPRQPGWVQIKTQGSAWVVMCKDPDTGSQMSCIGNTLDDALTLADLMLGSDDAPWEPDPYARMKAGGKKK